jgi:kinetochore protein Mis13/DSN1
MALSKPPTVAPLLQDSALVKSSMPDERELDKEELEIFNFLTDKSSSASATCSQMQAQLQSIHKSLEFKIDQLADGVHRLNERVSVAGSEADKVLAISAARLKSREDRERAYAGTKNVPAMEVLRSLGRILPESGGWAKVDSRSSHWLYLWGFRSSGVWWLDDVGNEWCALAFEM